MPVIVERRQMRAARAVVPTRPIRLQDLISPRQSLLGPAREKNRGAFFRRWADGGHAGVVIVTATGRDRTGWLRMILGGGRAMKRLPIATAPRVHHILRAKARHRPTAWLCRQPSANRSRPFSEQGFFLILSRKQGACAPTSTETSNFSRLFQRLRASGAHFPVIRWIRELNDHFREAESPGAGSPFAGSGPYEPRVYRSNKGAGPSGLGVAVPRLRQQKDHTIQAGIVNT